MGGSRHTTAHYRLQGVSWWRIGWGHKKSFPRPVLAQPLWGGFRSFLEIVRGVTVEHKMISRGVVRLHLGFLWWRGSSLGRLSSHLRRSRPDGGNACPGQRCSPTAIAVSRGLPLSTSVILDCTCSHRWRRPGEKRKRTEIFVSTLGHCFLAHLEHYAAARVHSATLRENRPSHGPHGEWHHDFPRLGPKRREEVLWRSAVYSLPPWRRNGAPFRLHFGHLFGHNQGVQES